MLGSNPIQYLNGSLGLDVNRVNYADVINRALGLDVIIRAGLLQSCSGNLKEVHQGETNLIRIALIRVLVALLPDSFEVIQTQLNNQSTSYSYEVHFTLFCYLDWSAELPEAGISKRVLGLVENYLRNVKSTTASAAWMAGELLGNHWDPIEAVPILLLTAETGRYVAGRIGSVHGLAMILRRSDVEYAVRQRVESLLHQISKHDVSKKVRDRASSVIMNQR